MTAGQKNKTPTKRNGADRATGQITVGRALALLAGTAGATFLATLALAQDGPNPSLRLTFGSALDLNDNRRLAGVAPGTSTTFNNSLGLSYLTETATSSLGITASTVLRYSKDPGKSSETTLDDPRFGLAYNRQGANSSFSLAASHRRAAVEFFDPFVLIDDPEAPVDSADLTPGVTGDRTDDAVRLKLETGIEGPFGVSLGLSHRQRDFSQTIDPDYFDTVTDSLSVAARMQISDRSTATLSYSRTDYSAENIEQTDRLTQSLSLGISHALTPDTALGVTLGRTEVTVDETIGLVRSQRSNDGLNAQVTLNRDLVNGGIGLRFSREISINGNRDSLSLNRNLELPDGSLAFSLGVTRLAGGSSTWVSSLAYRKDLPTGAITATLDRKAGSTDTNDEVTTTRARLGWAHELTPVTGIDVSFDYLDTNSDIVGNDRSRARLQVAYTWELAQDWQLAGGYTHTESRRETGSPAKSNAVFLSLERAFTFAP